jgi:hypothetical protein
MYKRRTCQRPFHRSYLCATPGQSSGDSVHGDEYAASTKDPMDRMEHVQRMQKKKLTKTCLLTPPPPSVWTWRDVQDVPKIFKQCCRKTLSEDICKLPRRCYVQYLDFTKIDLQLTKWRSISTCFVR